MAVSWRSQHNVRSFFIFHPGPKELRKKTLRWFHCAGRFQPWIPFTRRFCSNCMAPSTTLLSSAINPASNDEMLWPSGRELEFHCIANTPLFRLQHQHLQSFQCWTQHIAENVSRLDRGSVSSFLDSRCGCLYHGVKPVCSEGLSPTPLSPLFSDPRTTTRFICFPPPCRRLCCRSVAP